MDRVQGFEMMVQNMNLLTRGQLARSAGVGTEAVRFYERQGLLPEPERDGMGYRRYSEDAVVRLRFIVHAKDLGFTLREIHELLDLRDLAGDTCGDVRDRIAGKLEQVENKLRALTLMRTCLRQLSAACDGDKPIQQCPIIQFIEAIENPIDACLANSRKAVRSRRETRTKKGNRQQ